ncbi:MAG: hypothetical protein GY737_23025 [Desulfobacteraceae bacterium]|nr:hypothetical protein [Desulfobacteraceae bacterium]
MTTPFLSEIGVGVQLFIDLVLLGLFMVLFKRLKSLGKEKPDPDNRAEVAEEAGRTASQIIDMLEPLVKEADAAAASFDQQIRDKKNLIGGLNDSLDSRIISINLLLSRAEAMLDRAANASQSPAGGSATPLAQVRDAFEEDVFDQQQSIVDLYEQGLDVDAIASRLSMPKGEVKIVINLKKKFMAMETLE